MNNARKAAVTALCDVERSGSYSNLASGYAISTGELSRQDAAFTTMLVYGVLQRKLTLDAVISKYINGSFKKIHPFVLSVLRTGIYQLLFMDKVPMFAAVNESVLLIRNSKQRFAVGFANAVLRKAAAEKDELLQFIDSSDDPSVRYSCPEDIYDCLVKDHGKATADAFLAESLKSPKTYFRVNNAVTDTDTLLSQLKNSGIEITPCKPYGAFYADNAGELLSSEQFEKGCFFVQDKASQLAVSALGITDGMDILDVCAAPGGKSFSAAQYLSAHGSVVSCDIYEKRVGLIASGAKRLSLDCIKTRVADAAVFDPSLPQFDRVICDVPCSGLGVIRRKPEIKYRKISEYDDLPKLQLKILETSAGYLKKGGRIMYSTCTVFDRENRQVVSEFLKGGGFRVITEKLLMPQTDGSDGFYFCIMERD